MHVHKNDTVLVISGNAVGKQGKVLKVFPDKNRVIIENVNIVKRHARPNQKNPQGEIDAGDLRSCRQLVAPLLLAPASVALRLGQLRSEAAAGARSLPGDTIGR